MRFKMIRLLIIVAEDFEVVDLSIADNHIPGGFILKRLMAFLSRIHDGEAMKAQRSSLTLNLEDLRIIGTPVNERRKYLFEVGE